MKGNGKSFRQGSRTFGQENEAVENAIHMLDMRACLERYGVTFNMQGFAHCPFHKERTASFRIRGKFWHCFGCGDSGELIKFVRKKFDVSYADAIKIICEDFSINEAGHTTSSLDRLDHLSLKKYNGRRRYDELLRDLDICTKMYWLAYDTLEYAIQFKGGKSIENDSYVSAHFALMAAQRTLEQVEYECAQYVRDNPSIVQRPKSNSVTPAKGLLPPAPKWG